MTLYPNAANNQTYVNYTCSNTTSMVWTLRPFYQLVYCHRKCGLKAKVKMWLKKYPKDEWHTCHYCGKTIPHVELKPLPGQEWWPEAA